MEVKDEVATPFLKTLKEIVESKGIAFGEKEAPKFVELGLEIVDAAVKASTTTLDDMAWGALRPEAETAAKAFITKELGLLETTATE